MNDVSLCAENGKLNKEAHTFQSSVYLLNLIKWN